MCRCGRLLQFVEFEMQALHPRAPDHVWPLEALALASWAWPSLSHSLGWRRFKRACSIKEMHSRVIARLVGFVWVGDSGC